MAEIIKPKTREAIVNANTESFFKPIWDRNARVNLGSEITKKHKKVQNIEMTPFIGKMPLVCGSGKSLEDQIDLIKKYRDKLMIICADTTFAILYKHDIYPDFVMSVDAADTLKSCFAFKNYFACRRSSLIAATITAPEVLAEWQNKIYFYNLYDPSIPTLVNIADQMFPTIGRIYSKYNVGEFMVFFLVQYCSVQRMGITGIDYAYLDDTFYAHDEKMKEEDLATHCIAMDYNNKPVKTAPIFLEYARAFMTNYDVLYKKARIYSMNKGILAFEYEQEEFIKELEKM